MFNKCLEALPTLPHTQVHHFLDILFLTKSHSFSSCWSLHLLLSLARLHNDVLFLKFFTIHASSCLLFLFLAESLSLFTAFLIPILMLFFQCFFLVVYYGFVSLILLSFLSTSMTAKWSIFFFQNVNWLSLIRSFPQRGQNPFISLGIVN